MLTNEELHVLAAAGLRERIATMQAELIVYHDAFPELFISPTPPQLLKIPTNGNGNGHKPAVAAPPAVEGGTIATAAVRRRRRKMSREARAAISAAQKARWAKQRAGKRRGANA